MRLRHAVIPLLVLPVLAAAGFLLWLAVAVRAPGPLTADTLVFVPPGASVNSIAAILAGNGAVAEPFAFTLAARFGGGALKAGEYALPPHASITQVLALLRSGRAYQRRVTLAEGLTSREIVDIVGAAEGLEGVIEAVPPEGSLLPETYSYSRGDSRAALIARMQEGMRRALAETWESRAADLPLKTPEEALVLASIVEKETGVAGERARVAGVFVNRLRAGMPLQSDPTVVYVLTGGAGAYGKRLLRAHLKVDSPYNTYIRPGLPPGPIANPGRAALEAALRPEAHGYYYFVADGTGGHVFAAGLAEHNRNVAAWRRIRQARE